MHFLGRFFVEAHATGHHDSRVTVGEAGEGGFDLGAEDVISDADAVGLVFYKLIQGEVTLFLPIPDPLIIPYHYFLQRRRYRRNQRHRVPTRFLHQLD